ncbi:uncharacterized protein LOC135700308 [Ochlerotatus camptorhynchus]|uniref:uncharacterized protein LOC135700308 n=1 Tax=Ochlerotatus camptorhynchus TaxID=644619 RepID=UPI0031D689CF
MVSNSATTESKHSAPYCIACPENHLLFQCPTFSKMSVRQRRELVFMLELLPLWTPKEEFYIQVRLPNLSPETPYTAARNCNHEDTIHFSSYIWSAIPTTESIHVDRRRTTPGSVNLNPQVSLSIHSYQSTVLLETVNLLVVDQNGKEFSARVLLDSGSMSSIITKKLANTLNLRRTKVDIAVSGIGETSKQIKRKLTATIKSTLRLNSTTLEFLILKKPTVCLPTMPIDISSWKFPEGSLADPSFHIPADIDLIVGGEVYHELHTGSKISCGEGQPVFVETSFGWTVSGKVSIHSPEVSRGP